MKERRAHQRISPKGTLILLVGDHALRARVANIGVGGCLLTTLLPIPTGLVGSAAAMELRLDGQAHEWLQIHGRIQRTDEFTVAIAFDPVTPDVVADLQQMATASHSDRRVVSVVLVDATTSRRDSMAEAFRSVGCSVLAVSTPLEALVRLGESSFEPDIVAVADSLPADTSDGLHRFVERAHPNAKLVTIGNDLSEPFERRLANWLSAADPNKDLAARIREVMMRPMRR